MALLMTLVMHTHASYLPCAVHLCARPRFTLSFPRLLWPASASLQLLQFPVSAAPPGNKSSRTQRRFAALHSLHPMTSSWSEQEVALWLQEQGFGEFEEAFVSNKIDGRAIVNLSKEDLEDLGVKAIGKRAALVAAIVECFGKCAANKVEAAPAPPAATWAAQPVQQESAEADDGNYLANERIKLFIGGLTDSISKDMLQQELQQFAPVDEVIILLNPGTGTSKGSGFAFVVGKKNAEALMYVLPPLTPSPVLCRCVL